MMPSDHHLWLIFILYNHKEETRDKKRHALSEIEPQRSDESARGGCSVKDIKCVVERGQARRKKTKRAEDREVHVAEESQSRC